MSDNTSYIISIDNVENTQHLSKIKETAEEIVIDSIENSYSSRSSAIDKFVDLYDRYKVLLEKYISILSTDVEAMEQMMEEYDAIDEEQSDKMDEED